jgi:hypothetical protein
VLQIGDEFFGTKQAGHKTSKGSNRTTPSFCQQS